jgi:hypothetical protein
VDRHQGKEKIRLYTAPFSPFPQKHLQYRELMVGPSELYTEKDRQHHGKNGHDDTCNQELLSYHLVILTKHVFS